jgi:hypothetical protein
MTAGYVVGVATGTLNSGLLFGALFPAPSNDGSGLGGLILAPLSLAGSPWESLIWILASCGVLFPVGLAGVRFLPRGRVVFAAVLIFAIAMPVAFRYAYSWDIVKFLTAGMALAAFPFQAACMRLTGYARGLMARALLTTLACAAGLGWCVGLARAELTGETFINRDTARYRETAGWSELSPDDLSAISWLRARVRPCDLIYVSAPRFLGYGIYGGLPQFHIDTNGQIFQRFRKDVLAARREAPVEAGQGANPVTWFVLRPLVLEDQLILKGLEQNQIVVPARKFGEVTVYRLRGQAAALGLAACHERKSHFS